MAGNLMLEREALLAELAAAATDAARSVGRFVAVEGGAGLGKTTVLTAAAEAAEAAGCRALMSRGSELGQGYAFGVARQLLVPAVAELPAGDVFTGAAAPAAVLLGPVPADCAPHGDFATLHGLFQLTMNLCRIRPVAMVCDDLHWADEQSLRYLAYVAHRLDGMRLVMLAGVRPDGPGPAGLLRRVVTDPACTLLRLAPLSPAAGAELVREVLGAQADPEFAAACHDAAGGNPLLMGALAATARERGVPRPAEVLALAADAVGTRITTALDRLPDRCRALVEALAVLGGEAGTGLVARLAGMTAAEAVAAVCELAAADLVRAPAPGTDLVEFAHPVVRAGVYDGLPEDTRVDGHRRAAGLLSASGADAEQIAAHVLRVPAGRYADAVRVFRRSGAGALYRGAPGNALAYLRRCLDEPMVPEQRLAVLAEAAGAAAAVDLPLAAGYLGEAADLAAGGPRWAWLCYELSGVCFRLGRYADAWRLCREALPQVPAEDDDLRRRLYASMVSLGVAGLRDPDLVARLRALPPRAGVGGRMLDGVLALADGVDADPSAVARARRSVADGVLADQATGDPAQLCAWWTLLAADDEAGTAGVAAGVARAHRSGSHYALTASLAWRGLDRLHHGRLAAAVSDLRAAGRAATEAAVEIAYPYAGPWLAAALIEQGDLDGAEAALSWASPPDPLPGIGPWYVFLEIRARLLRARGRPAAAFADACAAGRMFTAMRGSNPAFSGWRYEAARCLLELGRPGEARELAAADLALAQRWGAPRTLGRSLRLSGLVDDEPESLAAAVRTLEGTSAALELAKSLAALGAAERRSAGPRAAREPLLRALELAGQLGAAPLEARVRAELRTAGARPRRTALTGRAALTETERRVAELAAAGHSNREIARALFVTPKTVEIHLTACYRKLGIRGRDQLGVLR